MQDQTTILEGYSPQEKGAYLTAIASIASADREASEEEIQYLDALADGAGLGEDQLQMMHNAAHNTDGHELTQALDVLKNSELRFSLMSDIIAFASADGDYGAEEKASIDKIANYLGINEAQKQAINEFTQSASQKAQGLMQDEQAQQNFSPNNFLGSLGIGDKLQKAGINGNSLVKGALGILGPLLLMRMFKGGKGGGLMGGLLGGGLLAGMMGGGSGGGLLGGLLGGGQQQQQHQSRGGGLLGSLLGGGRGFGSAGGMLGRILGGR